MLSAFQSKAVQDELIAEFAANSRGSMSIRKVREELAMIARDGYYAGESDTATGIVDMCAPIFDHGEGAVASLTVPYLKQRDVRVKFAAAREALLVATRRISVALGAAAAPDTV